MKWKIPKLNSIKLNGRPNLTTLAIVGALAVGVWYFGINPSTRKFDLLGMTGLNRIIPQQMVAPELPMDAIPVTSQKPEVTNPEPNMVNTVPVFPAPTAGAYATMYGDRSSSSLYDGISVS